MKGCKRIPAGSKMARQLMACAPAINHRNNDPEIKAHNKAIDDKNRAKLQARIDKAFAERNK